MIRFMLFYLPNVVSEWVRCLIRAAADLNQSCNRPELYPGLTNYRIQKTCLQSEHDMI